MAKEKDIPITLYCSMYNEQLKELTNEEVGLILNSIFCTILGLEVPQIEDRAVRLVFNSILGRVKGHLDKYMETCEKNRKIAEEREEARRKEKHERTPQSTNVHERTPYNIIQSNINQNKTTTNSVGGVCFDDVLVLVGAKQVQNPEDTAQAYYSYLQGRTDIKNYKAYFNSWYAKNYLPEVQRIEREEEARSVQQEEAERKKQAERTGKKAFEYYCLETKSNPNNKETARQFAEDANNWCKKHGNAELSVFYETFVKEHERKRT